MSTRSQASERAGFGRCVRPIAISVLIGTAVCGIILFLLSIVLTTQNIPQAAVNPMAIFALAVSGFVSGFCCARIMRENGLLYGALCGVAMTFVVMLASLAVPDNGFGIPALFKIVFIMLSAMLGGVLGVNMKRRRRK